MFYLLIQQVLHVFAHVTCEKMLTCKLRTWNLANRYVSQCKPLVTPKAFREILSIGRVFCFSESIGIVVYVVCLKAFPQQLCALESATLAPYCAKIHKVLSADVHTRAGPDLLQRR